jgi:heptaprenyl diphosphate synthase
MKIRIDINKSKASYVALMGILLGIAVMLTSLESIFSSFMPNGIRIGLSNIVIMLAVISINIPSAFALVLLKALFVLLTRGVTAGGMSLCGGLLAFGVTALLYKYTKNSYVIISIFSAIAHSAGQLLLAVIITESINTLYYLPVLIIASAAAGFCTGIVLNIILPHIDISKS